MVPSHCVFLTGLTQFLCSPILPPPAQLPTIDPYRPHSFHICWIKRVCYSVSLSNIFYTHTLTHVPKQTYTNETKKNENNNNNHNDHHNMGAFWYAPVPIVTSFGLLYVHVECWMLSTYLMLFISYILFDERWCSINFNECRLHLAGPLHFRPPRIPYQFRVYSLCVFGVYLS